eukprot:gnl/TRDRNA2_/TRDRNA2_99210_c2_seq1.p1 gnl/TRDRNA2_/TRDRNA2_99210_c2~~gnl/TRDRNA2_/TRDRNA2_99210_c2_seq1.p1  ORF type:complete len:110 (-),score=6.43 gnl/TRDRNA2_/TRDRNA2_99210_c2_seq1:524-853(-)
MNGRNLDQHGHQILCWLDAKLVIQIINIWVETMIPFIILDRWATIATDTTWAFARKSSSSGPWSKDGKLTQKGSYTGTRDNDGNVYILMFTKALSVDERDKSASVLVHS